MSGPIPLRRGPVIPERDLQWRFSRSSGPGGQHVNTSDTRVELSLDLAATGALTEPQRKRVLERLAGRLVGTTITVVASEHRSQLRNREAAMARLAALLDEALAPPPRARRATKPSRASVQRRLDAKRRQGERKRDRRTGQDPPGG